MSSAASGGKAWQSSRVRQQQQQQQLQQHVGSKIMEDSAISAARIKESQGSPNPEMDIPSMTVFERQEATDALSNLMHNNAEDCEVYRPREAIFTPCQTNQEFNDKLVKGMEADS